MLAKPSHQSTGNTKKKNKKDTSTSQQVHYRPGFMPVIPIYGEDITTTSGSTRSVRDEVLINEDQAPSRDRALTRPASSVFRRSLLFRKSGVPAGISKNHQSVDSLAVTREESRSVSKSQSGKSFTPLNSHHSHKYSIIHAWLSMFLFILVLRSCSRFVVRVYHNNAIYYLWPEWIT